MTMICGSIREMQDTAVASDLLRPYDARLMRCYPVSSRVNQVQNDDEEVLQASDARGATAGAVVCVRMMAKPTKVTKSKKPMNPAEPAKKNAGAAGSAAKPDALKGWQQIAAYLGHPSAVVQRWASEGMPVRRQGRFVTTTPEELNTWLGRESGKPVHVATEDTDLAAELKRGLSFIRSEKGVKAKKG